MSGTRVVLITAAGPSGQVDIGVRSDATPKDLVSSLGSVIGVIPGSSVVEHHAPPRPGVPQGRRTQLTSNASLGDSGVADGDMIIFRKSASGERAGGPGQRPRSASADATRPDPGYAPLPAQPEAGRPSGGRPPGQGSTAHRPPPGPGDWTGPRQRPEPPGDRSRVAGPRPASAGGPPRISGQPPGSGHQRGSGQPPPDSGQPPGSGYWSWSELADGGSEDTGQWTWSESPDAAQPAPVRGERPGTEKIYRPAHADSGNQAGQAGQAGWDAAHTDPTMPDLLGRGRPERPDVPRVDMREAGPGRAEVTRPARREPGAHRADGPVGGRAGGGWPGSGQPYRPGSTRGTDSDEPDDRH